MILVVYCSVAGLPTNWWPSRRISRTNLYNRTATAVQSSKHERANPWPHLK